MAREKKHPHGTSSGKERESGEERERVRDGRVRQKKKTRKEGMRKEEPKNLFLLTELNTCVCVCACECVRKIPSLDKENTSN